MNYDPTLVTVTTPENVVPSFYRLRLRWAELMMNDRRAATGYRFGDDARRVSWMFPAPGGPEVCPNCHEGSPFRVAIHTDVDGDPGDAVTFDVVELLQKLVLCGDSLFAMASPGEHRQRWVEAKQAAAATVLPVNNASDLIRGTDSDGHPTIRLYDDTGDDPQVLRETVDGVETVRLARPQ